MYDALCRSKLSSHLDHLYIVSGSFGSSTLSEQSCDGSCFFAHCHVVVHFCVTSPNTFTLATSVYEMKEELVDDFATLNELLSECRRDLCKGHINWSDNNALTIQLDLPRSYLEKDRFDDFERSMNEFMTSYWKVRSNLAQYAGKSDAGSVNSDDRSTLNKAGAAARPGAPSRIKMRVKRTGKRLRTLRRIFPKI